MTSTTGAIPIESYDGANLYYLEAAQRPSAVWRLPLAGGTPTKILDGVLNGSYDVAERGIYYLERVSGGSGGYTDRQQGETRLQFFDFASGATTTVVDKIGPMAIGLSASRDGRAIFFARIDSAADELLLVDHFR